MSEVHYNVEPRYSLGSSAMVDHATAIRVARDEKDGYEAALEGLYGPAAQAIAKERGLALIVFAMHELRGNWFVTDLITSELWKWPFTAKCPVCCVKRDCRRGKLVEHTATYGRRLFSCPGSGQFVGEKRHHDF